MPETTTPPSVDKGAVQVYSYTQWSDNFRLDETPLVVQPRHGCPNSIRPSQARRTDCRRSGGWAQTRQTPKRPSARTHESLRLRLQEHRLPGRQLRESQVVATGGVKAPTDGYTVRADHSVTRVICASLWVPVGTTMSKRKDYRSSRYAPFFLRKKVYERDAGQCQYCGAEVTMDECNIDHVIPYGMCRGMTSKHNLVVVCRNCNELKGGQLIPEELCPRKGEAWLSRKEKAAGVKTEYQKEASQRMRETISVIQLATAMGVELGDLYSQAEIERWSDGPSYPEGVSR